MYESVTFSQAYNGEEVRATHTGITNTNGMAVLYPYSSTLYSVSYTHLSTSRMFWL